MTVVISDSFQLVLPYNGLMIDFVSPGVLMVFDYSMRSFILADRPELPFIKFLSQAKMMYGGRIKFFKLGLSYMGWLILSVLIFGIIY